MEQLEQNGVGTERVDDGLHCRRVVEVASSGGLRQQQVISHHRRQKGYIGWPQPEPVTDLNCEVCTDDAVIAAAPLADVVNQGTENQEVRTRNPGGQCACVRGGFDQMPIDCPGVHRISWR